MNRRFTCWAGWYKPDGHFFNNSKEIDTIWPIVDNKTCGEINGEPRPDQFYCIAFSSEAQGNICRLLNEQEKLAENFS